MNLRKWSASASVHSVNTKWTHKALVNPPTTGFTFMEAVPFPHTVAPAGSRVLWSPGRASGPSLHSCPGILSGVLICFLASANAATVPVKACPTMSQNTAELPSEHPLRGFLLVPFSSGCYLHPMHIYMTQISHQQNLLICVCFIYHYSISLDKRGL